LRPTLLNAELLDAICVAVAGVTGADAEIGGSYDRFLSLARVCSASLAAASRPPRLKFSC
jgi:hypothetical protein